MKNLLLLSAFILSALLLHAQANTSSYKFNGEQGVFTENRGQVVDQDGKPMPDVLAKASMPGLDLYLTKTGVTYVLLQYTEDLTAKPHPVFTNDKKFKITYSRVDVALTGAVINNEQMQLTGDAGWQSNYYKTADAKGQLAVSHFTNLTVQNVYPGIDWVWKFNAAGKLEYDFIVHPGADPSVIKMQYSYADLTQAKNNLIISTRIGSMTEGPLQASCSNAKVQIAYNVEAKSKTVSFNATGYDKTKDLLIDPPLALNWSAQFGGSFLNGLRGVTTDGLYNGVYLCGYTTSSDFPTYNPHGGAYYDSTYNGQSDAILLKVDTNQNLRWATYMGGPGNDFANSISATLYTHQIVMTGGAETGFPVTTAPYTCTGQDMFAANFSYYNLQLLFSGLFGGNGTDEGLKINTDNLLGVYIVGYTNSTNNSFANIPNGGYNQTTVTGQEAFIMSLTSQSNGSILYPQWLTKYGGSGDDYATAVTTDSLRNVVVTGYTNSTNIPLAHADSSYYQTTNGGGNDGFILKFDPYHNLLNATYYGGTGNDYFTDVATGIKGNFVFTGRTNSPNFPLHSIGGYGYSQPHLADTIDDAFVIKCANNLTLKWATYYGGTAEDAGTGIATDSSGQMYVSGFTFSTNFPVDSFAGAYYQPVNAGNSDGFIATFTDLGIRNWSTYKGDSCYQYPYDITYNRSFNKFYVAGEGLLACGESLPDSAQIHNGVSSVGFCWGFSGQTTPTPVCAGFGVNVNYLGQPCPGQCNGAAKAIVVGAHGPVGYAWSSGGAAPTDNSLCPQESWVEVRDSLGCTAELDLNFSPLTLVVTTTPITCLPGPGNVTAIANGGNDSLHYQWSTSVGTYSDSTGIMVSSTGNYSVTVQDSLGCTLTATAIVYYNNVYPQGTIEVIQYPSCSNNSDGIVTLDGFNTDSISPYGNVTWQDGLGFTVATGDTFYTASAPDSYTAVDSAFCFNGLPSPVYYQFYLDVSTNLANVQIVNYPSSCISNDGQATVNYSPPAYTITGNNLYGGSIIDPVILDNNYPLVTYLWGDGEITQSVFDLPIGPYSVTVTDNNCQTVLSGTFTLPTPQVAPVIDSAYCNGGYIIPNPYGGNGGPYTYQWSDGSSNNDDFGPSGSYTVTITDQLSCADTSTFFIPQGTPLSVYAFSNPATCYGQNGVVVVEASAGVPSYQGTGVFPEPAGNYTVTVTDNDGCTATGNATVAQPAALVVTANLISPALCSGSMATYNVSATGGTGPYNGTGTRFEPAGTDVIIVTDINGCTGSTTIVVTTTSGGSISTANNITPIACYGGSATIVVTATGTYPPFTGTGTFTETAGIWYFVVSDANGCSVVDTVVITQPAQLIGSLNEIDITCAPGSATANILGGTGPYLYEWSTSPGFGDSATVFVGINGNYYLTVQDANGCSTTGSAFIDYNNSPYLPDSVIILQYPQCGLNNGVVYLQGGIPSLISWTLPNGIVTYGDTLHNAATSYTYITITDSSYCQNGQIVPVEYTLFLNPVADTFGGPPVFFFPYEPSGCNTHNGGINFGNEDLAGGGITINGSYYSPIIGTVIQANPVTFQWSNGTTRNFEYPLSWYFSFSLDSPIIGNDSLNPGTYSVIMTDGTCQYKDTFVLTPSSPPLVVNYTVTNPICSGDNNGKIKLIGLSNNVPNVYGDTTNVFLWSNGETTTSVSNLAAGTYSVSITGPNACPVLDTFTLTAPQALVLSDTITASLCYNGNASVKVVATGGTLPYTGAGNLFEAPGTQILTVTDSNGCTARDTVVVPHGSGGQIIASNSYSPILCYGDTTTVTITATGGNGPITGTGVFTETAGTYYLTISDSAGCSIIDTVIIGQPVQLVVSLNSAGITCSPGSVSAIVSGGTGTDQFEWSTSPGFGDSASISVGLAGNYYITVQDVNLCSATNSVSVNYNNLPPPSDSIFIIQYPSCGLSNGVIYIKSPNPSKITWLWPGLEPNSFGDTLRNVYATIGNAYVIVDSSYCVNGLSAPIAFYLNIYPPVNHTNWNVIPFNLSSFPSAGCNTIDGKILSGGGNVFVAQELLPNQPVFNIYPEVINYPQVSYQWSTGISGTVYDTINHANFEIPTLTGLDPGIYTLTVTDGTCQTVDTEQVGVSNPPLSVNYSVKNPACSYDTIGSIKFVSETNNYADINGDTTNTYLWSNGDTTPSINHLTSGTYTITITGPNACPVLDTFIVTAPPLLVQHDSINQPLCGGGNATIIVTATGGTSPYTGTGTLFKPAGTYVLTVTDSNGCVAKDSVIIPPSSGGSSLVFTNTATPILCNGEYSTLTVSAAGGTSPYTGTGTFSKPAGDYVITVTDNAGCSANDTVVITQPAILSVTKLVNPVPCYGDSATIILTSHGGTAPYTGLGTFKRPVGNYVFLVSDANGCSSSDTVNLTQPTQLSLHDTVTSGINCFGGHATVILTATGGTGPYFGTGTLLQPAGNDVLIVSDQYGCSDSVSLHITQPSQVNIAIQLLDSTVHCADTIKAIITATGGTGNYTGTGSITYTHSGTYNINVTDGSGCTIDTTVHITLDTCTGINNVLVDGGVTVYPNPASDKFYVKFLTALNAPTDVRLFAVDGKLVMLKTLTAGTGLTEMDCNQLASGVYILQTVVADKEYNFKVVVTR